MHIKIEVMNGKIEYIFVKDKGDGKHIDGKTLMEDVGVFFKNDLIKKGIHNDILCLVGLLLAYPFVKDNLSFSIPTSQNFSKIVNSVITRYSIHSEIDIDLKPRKMPDSGYPGLAFSGGCDSSAALCIMPENTIPVFLERPMIENSMYNSEAALKSCDLVKDLGYHIEIVESNFEYIRNPVGFPSDLAHASVLLLLAENLNLDSISFGTVLESSYGVGHEKFRDYGNGSHWKLYSNLFKSVGIELSLPVCGISEVGTAIICEKSPMGYISQSCIRGEWKEPCLKCWKCFRKQLLSCSLGFQNFSTEEFKENINTLDVYSKLKKIPISHENVLSFSVQKLNISDCEELRLLEKRLLNLEEVDFLEKWYSPSIEFVSEKYRRIINDKIVKILATMDFDEEKIVEKWSMEKFIKLKSTKKNSDILCKSLLK